VTNIEIHSEYITLGQFLKLSNIAPSGGMVKAILQEYKISVNGLEENRRGKKLYPGDKISIKSIGEYRIVQQ
jgi:S4 domain protein YaaA